MDPTNIDINNAFYNHICTNLKDMVHHPDRVKKFNFKYGIDSECGKCFKSLLPEFSFN